MKTSEENNVISIVTETKEQRLLFHKKQFILNERVVRKGEKLCEK